MRHSYRSLIIAFVIVLSLVPLVGSPRPAHAASFTAVQNGNWNDPATWGGGGVPTNSFDTATIPVGITVTITTNLAYDGDITNRGVLNVNRTSNVNGDITNYGTIQLNSRFDLGGITNNYGTINIATPNTLRTYTNSFTNRPGGTINVNGELNTVGRTLTNNGTIYRGCTGITTNAIIAGNAIIAPRCVTVADASAPESGNITFNATLDSAVAGFTADWALTNGTTNAADFTGATNGTLNFVGNLNEVQPIIINVAPDTIVEPNETFTITLSNFSNTTIGSTRVATGTILNDDTSTITINDVTVAESGPFQFTAVLSNAVQGGVSVTWTKTDGTTNAGDFSGATTGTLNFAGTAGEARNFVVGVLDDAITEPDETFTVAMTGGAANVIITDTGTGTIQNNDLAGLSINDVSVVEGNAGTVTATFTISLTAPAGPSGVTFDIATADGTATTANNDYVALNLTGQTIPAGLSTFTFNVTVNSDNVAEANETFLVNVSNVTGATVTDGQGQGTILNDDGVGVSVTQSGGTTVVTEGGATDSFTVVLASEPTAIVTITLSVGSEITLDDYQLIFTPADWNLAQIVTVTAVNDGVVDGTTSDSVTFAVSGGDYTGISVAQVPVTINDNDTSTITINDVTAAESGPFQFTAVLSNAVQGGVSVTWTKIDGTTNAGDFSGATTGTLNFAGTAGETLNFVVGVFDDAITEPTETFTVAMTGGAANVIITDTGTGTIQNNDLADLSINDVSVVEGNAGTVTATFTISLTTPAGASGVTFDIATADGTATTANNDYVALNLTGQTIPAGLSTFTFNVTVNSDNVAEANETFLVNVSNVTGASVTDGQGQGTIINDEGVGVSVTQSGGATVVTEGGATDSFTVVLVTEPTATVTITLSVGSEITLDDYQLIFTPADWNVAQTVTVTAVNDGVVDGTTSDSVTFAVSGGDYTGISIAQVPVTIHDNDTPLGSVNLILVPVNLLLIEDDPGVATFSGLLGQPPAPGEIITVNLVFDPTQITLSPSSLTFNNTNFNIPQPVTVDAVADGVIDNGLNTTITANATSNLGPASPFNGLTANVFVTIFDTADQVIAFVPNLGGVKILAASPTPLFDAPNGEPLRINQVTVWLPHDADGNGYDVMQITEIQVVGGEVWLGLWMGSARWAWIVYDAETMQLTNTAYLSLYNAQH